MKNEVIPIINRNDLYIESVLTSSRNSILYKVSCDNTHYVLKASKHSHPSEAEAFRDEYHNMKQICHPIFPKYYGYRPDFYLPGSNDPVPSILMEYIDGIALTSIPYLTTEQGKKYILDLGGGLLHLLQKGVLYLDLHPGNLLIEKGEIRLIDFTKAYYYMTNPYPSYTPKISYQVNQHLPGQQMLIQALTSLLLHLPEQFPSHTLPQSLIQLGLHPHSGLSFSDFLSSIEREWET